MQSFQVLQDRLLASEAAAAEASRRVLQHKGAVADKELVIEELREKLEAQVQRFAAALAAIDTLQVCFLMARPACVRAMDISQLLER